MPGNFFHLFISNLLAWSSEIRGCKIISFTHPSTCWTPTFFHVLLQDSPFWQQNILTFLISDLTMCMKILNVCIG